MTGHGLNVTLPHEVEDIVQQGLQFDNDCLACPALSYTAGNVRSCLLRYQGRPDGGKSHPYLIVGMIIIIIIVKKECKKIDYTGDGGGKYCCCYVVHRHTDAGMKLKRECAVRLWSMYDTCVCVCVGCVCVCVLEGRQILVRQCGYHDGI